MNISMRKVPKFHVGMVVYMHLSTALVTDLVRGSTGELPQVTIYASTRTLNHFVGADIMKSDQV